MTDTVLLAYGLGIVVGFIVGFMLGSFGGDRWGWA
jgi:hypothetical protein